MERAGENGRAEGRAIAADMLASVRALANGVYFIPSFKRYDVVADLISEMQ